MQSHLLRAPLTNIMGLVSQLKEEVSNTDHKLLNLIDVSAIELDNVIRKIVNKAKQVD